jgi:hypothetical protein
MQICASRQQEFGDLQVNVLETDAWRVNGFWRGRRVGRHACGEDVQGCRSIVVGSVHISAMRQELLHDAELKIPNGTVKRRIARSVAGIHERGILLQKLADSHNIPHTSSVMDAKKERSSLELMAAEREDHADSGAD